jgi:hypothetical protein
LRRSLNEVGPGTLLGWKMDSRRGRAAENAAQDFVGSDISAVGSGMYDSNRRVVERRPEPRLAPGDTVLDFELLSDFPSKSVYHEPAVSGDERSTSASLTTRQTGATITVPESLQRTSLGPGLRAQATIASRPSGAARRTILIRVIGLKRPDKRTARSECRRGKDSSAVRSQQIRAVQRSELSP